jgi:golgi-specific brefeldin A-resistance guanine nucleotide exchange factor 1
LDYQNTLELLTKGIAAGMEKSAGNEEVITLSGEILCNFIKTIEASLSKVHSKSEIEDLKELLDQRRVKMIYSEAAGLFNSNPKEALPFLQQKQLLSAQATPKEIAAFLRRAQGLDKKILGEYLVKPNHIEILREFFSAFKFSESTTIDSALRQVLESFRLPGEAQQIDRIMECFSEIYYPSAKATFSSQDACYVLAFSTLMLNTDLHNPQVKHKMTLPDFIRNNRGINDGKDVDEGYLTQLYNSIKTREIVMPEEHGGEEAFASQWNEVQKRKSGSKGKLVEFEKVALSPLVCGIVEIVWKPIILSLIPYINQQRPTGEVISDGPLEAIRGIASLFEKFQMTDALDALLGNIWSVSNLIPVFSAASGNMIPRYLARLPGFRQVIQLIVDIFRGQGDGLKSSWTNWCRLLIILSESGLIGVESVITQEAVLFDCRNDAVSMMVLMKMAHEGRQVQTISKQGFLSRFFGNSDTSTATTTINSVSTVPVINDEITISARQFVSRLPIVDVLINTIPKIKSKESFSAGIESICTHLKWNLAAGASSGKRISQASTIGLNWTEETLILLTESIVTIGLAVEPSRLKELIFNLVFDTFTGLILQDSIPPIKLCEHVVIGLGRLILRLSESGQLESDKFVSYLKFWCQLSPQLQGTTLEPFLALIALTFSKIKCQNSEIWPPMFTILSTATKIEASAPYTLKLLQLISDNSVENYFPVDFFTEFIDLLSVTIVGCTVNNFDFKVFDPWRNGKEVTRGQLAEESLKLYEKVFNLFNSVETFENWKNFLVPLESNLSRHAPLHPVKIIRQQSINLLARLLPQTKNFKGKEDKDSSVAPIIFSKILIPLLVDLRLRQEGCDEIVTRCASLTCKTFLLHLDDLGMPKGQLWKEILEAMLPLVLIDQPSEMVKEGVLESCKNVLLVMHSSEAENDSDVWRVSDVMLGPLIPGWKMEIEMRVSGGGGGTTTAAVMDIASDCEDIENGNAAIISSDTFNNDETLDINHLISETVDTTAEQPSIESLNSTSMAPIAIAPIDQTFSSSLRSPVNQSEDDIMAAFSQPDTFISLDDDIKCENEKRNDIIISSTFDV